MTPICAQVHLLTLNLGSVTNTQIGHRAIGHYHVFAIQPFFVSGQMRAQYLAIRMGAGDTVLLYLNTSSRSDPCAEPGGDKPSSAAMVGATSTG